jgi:hypothetical protein
MRSDHLTLKGIIDSMNSKMSTPCSR